MNLNSIFVYFILVVLYAETGALNWDVKYLASDVPNNATLQDMIRLGSVLDEQWGCLDNVHKVSNGRNKWQHRGENNVRTANNPLLGVTVWINEFLAVGHARYDLFVAQALKSLPVDRIILQRAPCVTSDLCQGIGTWNSFFQAMYASMIDAFRPGVPVFVRFQDSPHLDPHYLFINESTGMVERLTGSALPPNAEGQLTLHGDTQCFERVLRRKYGIPQPPYMGPETAQQFKQSAYKLVPPLRPLPYQRGAVINITYAYRHALTTRRIGNLDLVTKIMSKAFPPPLYHFQAVATFGNKVGYHEQIRLVAENDVVVTEHGAFQSNLIYMRLSSLLVDLRGVYIAGEAHFVESNARNFGVYFKHVITSGLKSLDTKEFKITIDEVYKIVNIVSDYCENVLKITSAVDHGMKFIEENKKCRKGVC